MATSLRSYLKNRGIDYEEVRHPREVSMSRVAERTHIHGEKLAKAVLIKSDSGFSLAVVPSTCRVDLARLSGLLQERLGLATEEEIERHFLDCEVGALPPLGEPYGVKVFLDDTLFEQPDIYFEAGDHRTLIHMSGEDFGRLMEGAGRGRISRHM
jgi:Ala-tRNA(Pro) deacylase